ncbi:hypothetical protein [Frankia sp. EAN1pec]|uniref:hypothetical protein n=1 Tax=Parafrankia sp. (strain EAN1pec) TaxID=298653 RepID=UPI0002DB537A
MELASTIQDNLAKSGSRMLETSNAWVPGVDSVAEGTWDAWLGQEEGRSRAETRILYDARIAPADTRLDDEASLAAALEHVYADCPWQDLRPIINRIWSLNARPDESKRKYLNRPTAAEDAWTTPSPRRTDYLCRERRRRLLSPAGPWGSGPLPTTGGRTGQACLVPGRFSRPSMRRGLSRTTGGCGDVQPRQD